MSGVYIKGLKMPQNCLLCPFGDEFGKCCVNSELEDANELTHSCPLIEIPDHGRLIDADALKYTQAYAPCGNGKYEAVNIVYESDIDAAPTVIEADRSEDGETKQISAEFAKLMREGEIKVWWRE